jgi:hypothetical protein
LAQAAGILDMPLVDHLIVGDAGQRQGPAHPQTTAQVRPRNDGPAHLSGGDALSNAELQG